jgi:MraZ protein
VFLGAYRHHVDSKGRVAVPAQFRRGLPSGSVVAYGPEGRLVIRPPEEWAALERQHRLTAETPVDGRKFLRLFFSSAREVELDAQGRMLIDAAHRGFARIADRAVFVGMGDCVEVVGVEVWEAENGGVDADTFTALNDSVMTRPGPEPAPTAAPA